MKSNIIIDYTNFKKGDLVIVPNNGPIIKELGKNILPIHEFEDDCVGFLTHREMVWFCIDELEPAPLPYFNKSIDSNLLIIDSRLKNNVKVYKAAFNYGQANGFTTCGSQVTCYLENNGNIKIVFKSTKQKTVRISQEELAKY